MCSRLFLVPTESRGNKMAIDFYAILNDGGDYNEWIGVDADTGEITFLSEIKGIKSITSVAAGTGESDDTEKEFRTYGLGDNGILGLYNENTFRFDRVDTYQWGFGETNMESPVKLGSEFYAMAQQHDTLARIDENTGCVLTTGAADYNSSRTPYRLLVINSTLYGVFETYTGTTFPRYYFHTIDETTGLSTQISNTYGNWFGTTEVVVGNELYAIKDQTGNVGFGRVNLSTAQIASPISGATVGLSATNYRNVTVSDGNNTIYALYDGTQLQAIPISTGVVTNRGADGFGLDITGTEATAVNYPIWVDGNIIGFDHTLHQFVKINPSNGVGSYIGVRQLGLRLRPNKVRCVAAA